MFSGGHVQSIANAARDLVPYISMGEAVVGHTVAPAMPAVEGVRVGGYPMARAALASFRELSVDGMGSVQQQASLLVETCERLGPRVVDQALKVKGVGRQVDAFLKASADVFRSSSSSENRLAFLSKALQPDWNEGLPLRLRELRNGLLQTSRSFQFEYTRVCGEALRQSSSLFGNVRQAIANTGNQLRTAVAGGGVAVAGAAQYLGAVLSVSAGFLGAAAGSMVSGGAAIGALAYLDHRADQELLRIAPHAKPESIWQFAFWKIGS